MSCEHRKASCPHRKLENLERAFDDADKAATTLDEFEFAWQEGAEREAVSEAADLARELREKLRPLMEPARLASIAHDGGEIVEAKAQGYAAPDGSL